MLTEIVRRLFPSYLLLAGTEGYGVPGVFLRARVSAAPKKDRGSQKDHLPDFFSSKRESLTKDSAITKMERVLDAMSGNLDLLHPTSVKNDRFPITLPPFPYMQEPLNPSAYKAEYISENSVAPYSMYGSYVDIKQAGAEMDEDNGNLDPKLDDNAIRRIIQSAKRDNLFGTRTYVNPMLKEKFDRWKVTNQGQLVLWYDVTSV